MSECGTYSCLGSRCVKPEGHDEAEHQSAYGSKWTDESDRMSAMHIARSMNGRTD